LLIIRPFQPGDAEYEAMHLVETAVYPENAASIAETKHGDAIRPPDQFFQRWVAVEDGRLVAFGSVTQPPQYSEPGRFRIHIIVHPDVESREVGTAVYDQIWQTLQNHPVQPTALEAACYEHHEQALRFLQKRGFQQVMRWVITRLDVPAFDAAPYEALFTILAAQGIDIITLPQLQQQDPQWLEKLYQLGNQLMQDVPLPYPAKEVSLDHFRQRFVENPKTIAEAWMVALDKGELVGDSTLEWGIKPGVLNTGFTGVLRAYRQRGLATALKVRTIEYAKAAGYQAIRTGNEENNPMLALNKKLGFKEVAARLAFEKRL
jgi:mycothiol synthase